LEKRRFPLFQALILTVFLAGLPIGSWYYLREGYNYRKALLEDLSKLGSLPTGNITNTRDSLISLESLQGKALLFGRLSAPDTGSVKVILRLADQFAESQGLTFLLLTDSVSATQLWHDHFAGYTPRYPGLFILIDTNNPQNSPIITQLKPQWIADNTLAVADKNGIIRRTYLSTNPPDRQRLVEHLAILIPSKSTPKPIVVREIEK